MGGLLNRKKALAVTTVGLVLTCSAAACSSSYTTPEDLVVIRNEAGVDHDIATSDAAPDPSDSPTACSSRQPSLPRSTAAVALVQPQFARVLSDGGTGDGWSVVGFDLDHRCTDLAGLVSTCKAVDGANPSALTDGVEGIDNSFGRNILPIITGLSSSGASSVTVDVNNGTGMLYVGGNTMGGGVFGVPVRNAVIDVGANGAGTFSATVPTAAFQVEMRAAFGRASASLCTGATIDSILTQIAQASDMLADGTQSAASTCAGISLGVQFTGATAAMPPAALVDPCSQ